MCICVVIKTLNEDHLFLGQIRRRDETHFWYLTSEKAEYTEMIVVLDTIDEDNMMFCNLDYGCRCEDCKNNTYNCIRSKTISEDTLYCNFEDDVGFAEMYNLVLDPYQLLNQASGMTKEQRTHYDDKLKRLMKCSGQECHI